jgi:hypothetical protein
MQNCVVSLSLLLMLAVFSGCGSHATTPVDQPRSGDAVQQPQTPVKWVEQGIEHDGAQISLGYRGPPPSDGGTIEPVASVTRAGKPVADAMVFTRLVSPGGSELKGDELATVYETSSDSEANLYTPGKLKLPHRASKCDVRFRIVLPDDEQDWTRDIEIPMK